MDSKALTKQAIEARRSGDVYGAACLLSKALIADPHSEIAWLWLANCLNTPEEKRYCFDQVAHINPDNEYAQKGVAQLATVDSVRPGILDEIPDGKVESCPQCGAADISGRFCTRCGCDTEAGVVVDIPAEAHPQETVKPCPYCAETIKAAAVVCRFCGRDLTTSTPEPTPAPAEPARSCPHCGAAAIGNMRFCVSCNREMFPHGPTDRDLLDKEISDYTRAGWRLMSQTETAFQVLKPKEWSQAGLALFVFLPALGGVILLAFLSPLSSSLWNLLFGVALLGFLGVFGAYAAKNDELRYITVQNLRNAAALDAFHASGKAQIVKDPKGQTLCSACRKTIRTDATTCKHCQRQIVYSEHLRH